MHPKQFRKLFAILFQVKTLRKNKKYYGNFVTQKKVQDKNQFSKKLWGIKIKHGN